MMPILILVVIALTLLHVLAQPIAPNTDGQCSEPAGAAGHRSGPFADLRAASLALEQRDSLVARVVRLYYVHGLDTAAIAARMQIDPASVERCLWIARQPPRRRRAARR